MPTTLTAMYRDATTAREAIGHLEREGFDRDGISLLVNQVARENDPYTQAKSRYWRRGITDAPMGILLGALAGVALGAGAGVLVSMLPLTYPLGTLAAWGAAIGAACGALTGLLLNSSVPRVLGQNLTTVHKQGASLVRVIVADDEVERAQRILSDHGPVEFGDRMDALSEKGWEAYDPAAEPMR